MAKCVNIFLDDDVHENCTKLKNKAGISWEHVLLLGITNIKKNKDLEKVEMGSGDWNKLFGTKK